tara:strand:- start:65 stop:304 length:240 start_codon:yes stop_codon:yes gene_type:complete
MNATITGEILGECSITKQNQPIDASNKSINNHSLMQANVILDFEPNGIEINIGERLCFNGKEFTVTYFEPGRIEGLTNE